MRGLRPADSDRAGNRTTPSRRNGGKERRGEVRCALGGGRFEMETGYSGTDSRNSFDRSVNSRPEFYSPYVSLTLSLLFRIIYATLSYYFTENTDWPCSRAVNASRSPQHLTVPIYSQFRVLAFSSAPPLRRGRPLKATRLRRFAE